MCKSSMEIKTIKVSLENWKKLMKWKTEFECKNLDEIIEKILNILPTDQLK